MTRMLPPAPGMGGLDIETPAGKVKLNADKAGAINVENDLLKTKLKMEGFTAMSEISLSLTHIKGHPCMNESCAFQSVFTIFTCPRCGYENNHLEDKD
jgi:ribosomal protein S27E